MNTELPIPEWVGAELNEKDEIDFYDLTDCELYPTREDLEAVLRVDYHATETEEPGIWTDINGKRFKVCQVFQIWVKKNGDQPATAHKINIDGWDSAEEYCDNWNTFEPSDDVVYTSNPDA